MSKQPHVIYIISDEHRGTAMSHMGDPNVRTPNMDRLAAEGVSFSRAYANCPICTPSRGTIFSGRHAHAGPVAGFYDIFKPGAPSTATILRQQGYHTAYFGKWHCGIVYDQIPENVKNATVPFTGAPNRTPESMRGGFQDWRAFEYNDAPFTNFAYFDQEDEPRKVDGYQTDTFTDMVIDYLRNYDRDQPLFLVLSVEPPHFPCNVPDGWKRLSGPELKVGPSFNKLDPFFQGLEPQLEDEELRSMLANYYGQIENLDWNIGRLAEATASLPGFENTLTAYFSDHGDYAGNHGLRMTKVNHHEESVRIPSIFHWPGHIPAQGNTDGLFSLVDLLSTTCGLLDIPVPSHSQGTNFSPALRKQDFDAPQEVLLEMHNTPRFNPRFADWRGFVTDKWKYAYYEDRREALFDLENDPHELHDLARERPDICQQMQSRLLKLLHKNREPYFDVIIEHGVDQQTPDRLIYNLEEKHQVARWSGGL